MPRKAREVSETGIYHVLMRGIDNRNIFQDENDKQKFVDIIFKKRDTSNFNLYAYCVMDNHVHFVIREDQRNLSSYIKGIIIGYVCYHNKKYGKAGHLFYDRFKSETISDERQILAAIRFVHNNPVKESIAKEVGEYKWSSYNSYIAESFEKYGSENVTTDYSEILSIFSKDKEEAVRIFVEFSKSDALDIFCDYNIRDRDLELIRNRIMAKEVIAQSGIGTDAFASDRETLRSVILKLRNEHDISLRQIAEILKLNRGLVQRLSAP